VAALGGFLIPALIQQGYGRAYSGSLLASGATIGVVFPPSIPMIIFGVSSGASVVAMFMGGIIPGFMMIFAVMIANWFISRRRGYRGEIPKDAPGLRQAAWKAKWALFLPVLILGGIYGGIFTPTEAAVVGSVYALLVGALIYRTLTLNLLREAMIEAGLLSSVVMFILAGPTTFGRL